MRNGGGWGIVRGEENRRGEGREDSLERRWVVPLPHRQSESAPRRELSKKYRHLGKRSRKSRPKEQLEGGGRPLERLLTASRTGLRSRLCWGGIWLWFQRGQRSVLGCHAGGTPQETRPPRVSRKAVIGRGGSLECSISVPCGWGQW